MVNQREVFADTHGFAPALKHVLRQDPDIVLIGEMRDLETIEAALVVAETGHLVFSTLHTNSAVQTINRVIDVFPPHQQEQVRAQLSLVLQGVVSQQLVPRADGRGRCLASEIMIPNAAIRNLIREAKVHQMYSQMQVGQQKFGMQTMSQSLCDLHQRRFITTDEAMGHATEPEELKQMLGQQAAIVEKVRPLARH
jgi:twitching motility protein PilT